MQECLNEVSFPDLQRILDFLLLRNLLSNELFFTFCEFATVPFIFYSYFIYFSDSANNLSTYLFNSFLGKEEPKSLSKVYEVKKVYEYQKVTHDMERLYILERIY